MEEMVCKAKNAIVDSRAWRATGLFTDGVMLALSDPTVIGTIGTMTLIQGLKYRGSVKAGIQGGLYTAAVLGTLGGVQHLVVNRGLV